MHDVKRFIVVGHPRSGSTFLMNRLAMSVDAFTPNVNHEELFNVYERLFNCCVLGLDGSSERGMAEMFFQRSQQRFAGFKTMPSFHHEWQDILASPEIQFITLMRQDFLSCLASTIVSERIFDWRSPAREQLAGQPLKFATLYPTRRKLEIHLGLLLNRLLIDYRCLETLNERPSTIALTTEALTDAGFRHDRLDNFFEKPIVLRGFMPPTNYRECFDDPADFRQTVVELMHGFLRHDTRIPEPVASLLAES